MVHGILHCVEAMTALVFRQEEVYPKDEKSGFLHGVGVCVYLSDFIKLHARRLWHHHFNHFKLNTEAVSMFGLC